MSSFDESTLFKVNNTKLLSKHVLRPFSFRDVFGLFGGSLVGELGPKPGSMDRSAPRGRPGATNSYIVNLIARGATSS